MAAPVTVLLVLTLSAYALPTASAAPALTQQKLFDSHISHIVFLVQENHAFDSIYGEYCPTVGPYCRSAVNGIPPGTCIPKVVGAPRKGCIAPYNFSAQYLSPPVDLIHDWNSTHEAWDNGSMNGFYAAEQNSSETFGHYNATTAPVYWDLAEQYGLADDFFSSVMSYSLPNHWYVVASAAPSITYGNLLAAPKTTWTTQSTYLNESNATPTIEDELVNSSVSWAYFDNPLVPYAQAIAHPLGPAYGYWNPLAGRAQSYAAKTMSHFQNRTRFFSDAANGTLPNVSWIIPAAPDSDHPPYNLTSGQDWVADVVDALELSPEWNSTVLFVSWDEYGGFYDGVAPPTTSAYGDGFRVPLLAIGPWVKEGYVDPTTMTFGSILHLIEVRFGLACLGPSDCSANLPLSMFDFYRSPRRPIQILDYGAAVYPMRLESSGKLPRYGLTYGSQPVHYQEPPPVPASLAFDPTINWS